MMHSIYVGLLGCVGLFGGQIVLGRNQLHMIMYSIYYVAAVECGFGFFGVCVHAGRYVCVCVWENGAGKYLASDDKHIVFSVCLW